MAAREEAARREAEAATKREQVEAARQREAAEAARRDRYHIELRQLCTDRKERQRANVAAENRLRVERFEEEERARLLAVTQTADSGEAPAAAAPATACRLVHAANGLHPSKLLPRVPPGRMAALCGGHGEITGRGAALCGSAASSASSASSASTLAPALVPSAMPPGRMAGLCLGAAPSAGDVNDRP